MTTTFDTARCTVGLELGSTRIKAVLLGPDHTPLAQGDHVWETGLKTAFGPIPKPISGAAYRRPGPRWRPTCRPNSAHRLPMSAALAFRP